MLALLRRNAPDHLNDPEFQADLLDLIDDALKRMQRLEKRLTSLKDDLTPEKRQVELHKFLMNLKRTMTARLPGLEINIEVPEDLKIVIDPEILTSILENLLINSLEAGGPGTRTDIQVKYDHEKGLLAVNISDTGPGIPENFLP